MRDDRTYAPDWTEAERAQWREDYSAGRPVLMPHPEHDDGECSHCDLLREMIREEDDAEWNREVEAERRHLRELTT